MNTIRSPLRYPGGKSRALKTILPYIPPFSEFREPFVGGGSVFLAVKQQQLDKHFWINDLNYDLVCFWQALQRHPDALTEAITDIYKYQRDGRALHHHYIQQDTQKLSDVERAVRFFILNRITFSGTIEAGGYSQKAFEGRFTHSSIQRLAQLPSLLDNIHITHGDYEDVLRAAGKDVFIFLDPPYVSATKSKLYGKKGTLHTSFDHQRLATILQTLPHPWLMTYDDSADVRRLYDFAYFQEWQLQYGMNNYKKSKVEKGKELLISNYPLVKYTGQPTLF